MGPRASRFLVAVVFIGRLSAQESPPGWQPHELPFRPLSITSAGQSLWVCGTDAAIAVSLDDGRNWKVVRQEVNGRVLLNIAFADAKFGYAAGSNGLLLMTNDGGATWTPQTTTGETILQVSFADPQHGLIRTPSGLMFTVDGGAHWPPVPTQDLGARFRYSFALAALDAKRMMIALKSGPAQFNSQAFLFTVDGGMTWTYSDGPDAILSSFVTLGGEYWAVGEQTVDKKKNGGRSLPVALHSPDGQRWNRSRADLSVCQDHGCTRCTDQGCLAGNGTVAAVFRERVGPRQFPPNGELTTSWAATNDAICIAGSSLQCASLQTVKHEPESSPLPSPPPLSQPPLGSAAGGPGPRCLVCGIEPSLLASDGYGSYELRLTFEIAPNGTVQSVEVVGAPVQEIANRIGRRVRQWVFEPTIVGGVARSAKATTSLRVDVSSR
jgi:hypothetical protein